MITGPAAGDASTSLESLPTALDRLVRQRILSAEQARAVLRELAWPGSSEPPPGAGPELTIGGASASGVDDAPTGNRSWIAVLGEVGGYVGAAFVFGGCVVLVGSGWDALNLAGRVALLAGPALALLMAAALIGYTTPGGWTVRPSPGAGPRRRLVSALAAVAASLSAGATAQLVDQPNELLAAAGTATAVCALAYATCRSTLMHLALGVAFATTAAAAGDRIPGDADLAPWGLVAAGALWVGLVAVRILTERTLGDVFGAALLYVGGELLALGSDRPQGYLVVGLVAVAGLFGYQRTRRVPVLVVGVVALATVIPETVTHYAGGTLQAGGALLVTGLSVIGASALGLVVHRTSPSHRTEADSDSGQAHRTPGPA